jgi:hypothetical protein
MKFYLASSLQSHNKELPAKQHRKKNKSYAFVLYQKSDYEP